MSQNAISLTESELLGDSFILDLWATFPDGLDRAIWLCNHYGITAAYTTWENAGYYDCWNLDLPMARTLMALFLLTHASDDLQTYLEQARINAMNLLTDTRWAPTPSSPFAVATTWGTSRVELHNAFLTQSVVERAATLWHEAIHMNGDPHDAFFPAWSDLYQQDLSDGQADEYFGTGAYTGSTTYLMDYIANATLVTPLLRAMARQRANWELDNCFAQHPGFTVGMPLPLVGDFDSNLYTDFSVYRPSNGHFYILPNNSLSSASISLDWGQAVDLPVPGCYKCPGVMDYALYRPADGYWRIKSGINGSTEAIQWGAPEDIPVPADFNGDGYTDLAVWRPSTGYLYNIDGSSIKLGRSGDIPVAGYFYEQSDSDTPRAFFAVFRPASGNWRIWNHKTNKEKTIHWGQAGDIPVPGDYDGDGVDELAVWRPSDGMWHVYNISAKTSWSVQLGAGGDIPVPGYYYDNGDDRLQMAVWRPSNGKWYINIWDTDTMYAHQWGQAGDIPIPGLTGWLYYRRLMQDLDGDGRTELGVFRPSTQKWYLYNLAGGSSLPARTWAVEDGDIIVPADYNGDGRMEYATWRPSTGIWRWYDEIDGSEKTKQWGQQGDIPVPADYDGDGCAELAVWRPSNGKWYVKNVRSGDTSSKQWGQQGDIPAPADFDGDGRADYAIWRCSNGQGKFRILQSLTGEDYTVELGASGDIPVPADYDGDGRAEAAIWKPYSGYWWRVDAIGGGEPIGKKWGKSGDIPVPGDYDGDGRMDLAVWRPSNGKWYIIYSKSGQSKTVQFGTEGDVPTTATAHQKAQ